MNRNDMPFLGVYDNVRYSPNCTPTTYQHWGWGFVSEHFVPQFFFGSYNIVVFLTICISYANNCFTL